MRRRKYYIQRIDPPIGGYDRIVTWDDPPPRWWTRLKWKILDTLGIGKGAH